MSTKNMVRKFWRVGALIGMAGTVFAASCNSNQVQAVVTGIETAITELGGPADDAISFGDWLLSELDD